LIAASTANNVPRFVYTSSVNVIFDGKTPIINGDEKVPYPTEYPDPYGASKAEAEKLVIAANGKNGMVTCSLRPNGLYGPGDHTLSRSLKLLVPLGGAYIIVGTRPPSITDWTYVENIAYASILAASKLGLPSKVPAGQCYHVTDGVPVNIFEFLKHFVLSSGMGYNPLMQIPPGLAMGSALLNEWLCYMIRPIYHFQPVMSGLEVSKLCITHYFNIEKAARDLQYKPLPEKACKEVTARHLQKVFKYSDGIRNLLAIVVFCVFLQIFLFLFIF